jgi:hypothetical protein
LKIMQSPKCHYMKGLTFLHWHAYKCCWIYMLHKVTNGFVDELFSLLWNSILPKPNNLPMSHHSAKSLIQNLCLGYNIFHACDKGCVLFCNQYNVTNECHVCSQFQYVIKSNKVPKKVLKHFSLFFKLKRMFKAPNLAKLQTWRHGNNQPYGWPN